MDSSIIARKYNNAVKKGKITSHDLARVPKLVTCSDWSKVDVVGSIDYKLKVPAVHYNGLLAHYKNGLYYLSKNVSVELGKIDKRFKKGFQNIKVV